MSDVDKCTSLVLSRMTRAARKIIRWTVLVVLLFFLTLVHVPSTPLGFLLSRTQREEKELNRAKRRGPGRPTLPPTEVKKVTPETISLGFQSLIRGYRSCFPFDLKPSLTK